MMGNHLQLDCISKDCVTLWVDVAGRSVNALSTPLFDELEALFPQLESLDRSRPLVLRSRKDRGFIVGADLREILACRTAQSIEAFLLRGQQLFQRWAQVPMTTIAWIRGACLGGGLEWALVCTYRFASQDPQTVLGLPESKLGLTPAWGGTQRLPALIGMELATRLMLQGDSVASQEALRLRLVDGMWDPSHEEAELGEQLASIRAQDQKTERSREEPSCSNRERAILYLQSQREQLQRELVSCEATSDAIQYRARLEIVDAMLCGQRGSLADGMRHERTHFFALLNQPAVQKNLERFLPKSPPSHPTAPSNPMGPLT